MNEDNTPMEQYELEEWMRNLEERVAKHLKED